MPRPPRPHVLLITTDHWPAHLLGAAGHPTLQTPTLDDLCRAGVRYTNTYSECPVCIPARRSLLTGTPPRTHGDRTFQTTLPMPDATSLAAAFADQGYQTQAVGKLHVYPQRDRVGFDDVLLAEEGRPLGGAIDDYEMFLGDRGHAGRQFDHAMSNNQYWSRTWHLPEDCHVTNWIARETARQIRRRDPTRPGFWYMSFTHPHPPLVPLPVYWELYRDAPIDLPPWGDWSRDASALPYRLQRQRAGWNCSAPEDVRRALRAFFALCTHIDHQIRLVLGTLREEGLLDHTAILFSSDHGDLLGQHGLWAKRLFYEGSANVPMIVVPPASDTRLTPGTTDDRLAGWQDIMPTLLDLAGLDAPESCEGISLLGPARRRYLYGESEEGVDATRMIHDGRHKLVYYPCGNHLQLFDLASDPDELHDVSAAPEFAAVCAQLEQLLIGELYGNDLDWIQDGRLCGLPTQRFREQPPRDLFLQRGVHWPPPPPQ